MVPFACLSHHHTCVVVAGVRHRKVPRQQADPRAQGLARRTVPSGDDHQREPVARPLRRIPQHAQVREPDQEHQGTVRGTSYQSIRTPSRMVKPVACCNLKLFPRTENNMHKNGRGLKKKQEGEDGSSVNQSVDRQRREPPIDACLYARRNVSMRTCTVCRCV